MVPPQASCFDPLLLNGIFFPFVMLSNLVMLPTLCVVSHTRTLASQTAEQFDLRSHAERGNDRFIADPGLLGA